MLLVASHDAECIGQLADGDDSTLGELFDSYAPSVLALLQAILGPSHEAEEQLHELFLELWRSAPTWDVRAPQPLRTWLLLRARARAVELLALRPELGCFGQRPALLPSGWRPPGRYDVSVFDEPHLGRERARVRCALARLSAQARTLLALSYLRGLKSRELATAVQESTREAGRRLAFAFCALRDHADDGRVQRPLGELS